MPESKTNHAINYTPRKSPSHPSKAKPIFAEDIAALESILPNVQIIDIREAQNYRQRHIPNARHCADFQALAEEILAHPKTPYLLHCYSGYTVSVLGSHIANMGAKNVYYFDESFEALDDAFQAREAGK